MSSAHDIAQITSNMLLKGWFNCPGVQKPIIFSVDLNDFYQDKTQKIAKCVKKHIISRVESKVFWPKICEFE